MLPRLYHHKFTYPVVKMATTSPQPHRLPTSSAPFETLPAPTLPWPPPSDDFETGYVPFLEHKAEVQGMQIEALMEDVEDAYDKVARLKMLLTRQMSDFQEKRDDYQQLLVNAHRRNCVLDEAWRLCERFLKETGLHRPFRWWLRRKAMSRGLKSLDGWPV